MQQWTEYLLCPVCRSMFGIDKHRPISLSCGHTICKMCLGELKQKNCPFDGNAISKDVDKLPVNLALLQLVGAALPECQEEPPTNSLAENTYYNSCKKYMEELAIFLKAETSASSTVLLSRPMQRKLVALVSSQLVEEEGRLRAMRAARSLGERAVTELILQHQNQQQLSANLWAAVRARGCQFLGPAMQEEVLKLILLALEDGSALSRKVLVLFVVQRLESQYPQASKTAIGHVVQLLYRASCFKVTKRHEESSLMQLKEEIRTYEALRHEHDAQIIQIATEAGLRISPEQWSSLLYGDTAHKSQMQSIIDKLQTPQSFSQSVQELVVTLQRIGDPGNLIRLEHHLELLSNIDPSPESPAPSWENLEAVLKAVNTVVQGVIDYMQHCNLHKLDSGPAQNTKYKTSLCRDFVQKGNCPRGASCTFAHSQDELERYRVRHRKPQKKQFIEPVAKGPSQQQRDTKSGKKLPSSKEPKLPQASTKPVEEMTHQEDVTSSEPADSMRSPQAKAHPFTVPVAKPMPMSQKGHPTKQMIYTSPTVGRSEPPPEVIPIARQASNIHKKGVQLPGLRSTMGMVSLERNNGISTTMNRGSVLYSVQPVAGSDSQTPSRGISPTHSLRVLRESPYYHTPPGDPPLPINAIQASAISALMRRQPQYRGGASSCSMAEYKVEPDGQFTKVTEQAAVGMMPPNPYTGDYYRRHLDTEAYAQISEASHLEVLHRRKNELIQQLNKTKHFVSTPCSETLNMSTSSLQSNSNNTSSMFSSSLTMSHMSLGSVMSSVSSPQTAISQDILEAPAILQLPMSLVSSVVMPHMTSPDDVSQDPVAMMHSEEIVDDVYFPWSPDELPSPSRMIAKGVVEVENELEDKSSFNLTNIVPVQPPEPDPLRDPLEDDDEFIPFQEHATVSKYGPISRLAHTSRTKNTGPLQVTAAQPKRQVMPVTAVTPIQRPYPISMEVPSQFCASPAPEQSTANTTSTNDHQKDPNGYGIAASLPTAFIQPSLIKAGLSSSLLVSGLSSDADTVWNLKEKMLNMPGSSNPVTSSSPEQDKICHELAELTRQIDHLEMSEHDRLSRELQAVKMRIQEAERQRGLSAHLNEEQKNSETKKT